MAVIQNKWEVKSKKPKKESKPIADDNTDTATFVLVRHAPMIKTLRGLRK